MVLQGVLNSARQHTTTRQHNMMAGMRQVKDVRQAAE
jgi:hypothetical protein